jgi:hypothetical protein
MKLAMNGLPLLVMARAAARRAQALEAIRVVALAGPPAAAAAPARPEFELVRRYVRR